MKSKKLLHVIANMNPQLGGVCEALRTIIPTLSQKGIYSEVVSLDSENAKYIAHDQFVVHSLGPGKGPWQYSSKLVPWLVENLPHFDFVVVHGLWLYHGFAVRKALRKIQQAQPAGERKGVPKLIVFPHGMLDPYFQMAPGRKIKAIRNFLYWKLVEEKVVNEADVIFFTAEDERQLAQKTFHPYKPKSESVVGLGITSPPPYRPEMQESFFEKCPQNGNSPYLLFLSRLHEKKGVDLLINAYKHLSLSLPDSQRLPNLVIAGPGLESAYGRYLVKLASDLPHSIFFSGMLSGDAKWGAFYGCEAFILPTHQENFGIAIVEALACKKPVLISSKTNIWREIDSSGAGIVEEDTLSGTVNLLSRWCNLSEEEKTIYGVRAINAYKSHFSVHSMEQKWLSLIQQ